jgi:membrane-associated phospholipid phosphatase
VAVVMVVLVAVLTAAVLVFEFELRRRRGAPLDTERAERWFVRHAPRPLARVLRAADRRVAGGAATAAVFVVLFVASLAVGWIFDGIDDRGGIARWDRSAAVWGAEHATDSSVRILDGLTQLGATGWLLGAMVVVGVVESRRHRRWAELGYLLLVGAGVSLLNSGLKLLVGRERPDIARLASFGGSSFPSGHAAAAAACWAAIAFVVVRRARRRRARALAAATAATITAAVATSRVLLGVHWLSDVVAGVVTGWAWFVLVTLLFGGRILRFGEPAERIGRTRGEPSPDGAAAVGPV